jgi:AcrR family transcriptional regulator
MAYHHGGLRQALVRQALAALRDAAWEDLSLRALSGAIGVSHTAAYRHFPDKQALLDAVAEEGFREFSSRLRAVEPARSAIRRIEAMAAAYIAFGQREPNLYRLMFGPGFLERVSVPGTDAAARDSFSVLLETVRSGQADGSLKAGNAFLLSQTIWALLHGITLFALDGELAAPDAAQVGAGGWRFLLEGIRAPRARRLRQPAPA